MELDAEIIKTLVNGLVWIVALVVLGRLGMFVATRYFAAQDKARRANPADRQADPADEALQQMHAGRAGPGQSVLPPRRPADVGQAQPLHSPNR